MAAISYKCPNCSAALKFEPGIQKFLCDFCDSEFTKEELSQSMTLAENDSVDEEKASEYGRNDDRALLYNCPGCGAQIVTDATTAATSCYYCHSPIVLSSRLDGDDEPDYVIPFEINRSRAEEIFSEWIKRKKFVPADFYNKRQIETMSGVYFPFHLYSCDIKGGLEAKVSKSRTSRSGNMETTTTEIYEVKKNGDMRIDNMGRIGLAKANKLLVEGALPFDSSRLKKFDMSYLSGFMAESKDIEAESIKDSVTKEAKAFGDEQLMQAVAGYNVIEIRKKEAEIENPEWKYALMPVWTMTYKDRSRDQVYYFSVNGQSGKVVGEVPVDMKKLYISMAAMALPVTAILLAAAYFLL